MVLLTVAAASTPICATPIRAPLILLTKHVALGNDFLIAVEPPRSFTPGDAVAWCDRRRGVGADGLISLTRHPEVDDRWVMVLLNSDGSQAEISGNGIRCAGQALARHAGIAVPGRIEVDTDAGLRTLDLRSEDGADMVVRADMGTVRPGPADFDGWEALGVAVEQQMGLDIGNPHLVAVVDDPDRYDLATIGPAVESAYPGGINVHLIRATSPEQIRLRVWERGAGLTEACGSGACAAAAAAHRWGLTDTTIRVQMPGGEATVDLTESGNIGLTGPATFIASISVDDSQPHPAEA